MKCKLCLQDGPLIKSHLIPDAFYQDMLDDRGRLSMTIEGRSKSQIKQSGEWDRQLNCEKCEQKFGPWDKEGIRAIRNTNWDQIRMEHDGLGYYLLKSYSYIDLKLFFMSILWRLAASDRVLGYKLDLGKRLKPLRQMVFEGRPGRSDEYGVFAKRMVSRTHTQLDPTKIICSPHSERLSDGLRAVRLHFGGLEFIIKTDSRPWHGDIAIFALKEHAPWWILEGEYESGLAHWMAMSRVFNTRAEHR